MLKVLFFFIPLLFSCSVKNSNENLVSSTVIQTIEDENNTNGQIDVVKGEDISKLDMLSGENYSDSEEQGLKEYEVKPYDSLMIISYRLYGTIDKWRSIRDLNPEIGINGIYPGMKIKYLYNGIKIPQKDGLPYIVKRNDTIPVISRKVYGTHKLWRSIWYNNRDIIRNPDLIFEGFLLFYPEKKNLDKINKQIIASNFTTKKNKRIPSSKK